MNNRWFSGLDVIMGITAGVIFGVVGTWMFYCVVNMGAG